MVNIYYQIYGIFIKKINICYRGTFVLSQTPPIMLGLFYGIYFCWGHVSQFSIRRTHSSSTKKSEFSSDGHRSMVGSMLNFIKRMLTIKIHKSKSWKSFRYLIFYSPFDIVYKICKFLPVKLVIASMKEVMRCKKVYDGVVHAAKIYPNAYLIMIIIGVIKGICSNENTRVIWSQHLTYKHCL